MPFSGICMKFCGVNAIHVYGNKQSMHIQNILF